MHQFIRSLTPAARQRYEKMALKVADPLLAGAYQKAVDEPSPLLIEVYQRLILERFLAGWLQQHKPPGDAGQHARPRRSG